MAVIPYLSNAEIFAVYCKDGGDRITVGILAIRSSAVFGTVQTLYDDRDRPYTVTFPPNPQEYNEVLTYARAAV